jgi:hypothetical protein
MILAYLDESYSPKWPAYWMGAVVCPEHVVDPLTRDLDEVVRVASDKHGLELDAYAELHGQPLFHGRKEWSGLSGKPRARIGVYHDALAAIASYDVRLVLRGVHTARLAARYAKPWHPHRAVLQFALEDIDCIAEECGELALVIADEIDTAMEHRRSLWAYQRSSTAGHRARQLTRIVDTLHFAPSSASRLVQAADVVAFLHGRMHSGLDQDGRAISANRELWSILSDRIYNAECWYP